MATKNKIDQLGSLPSFPSMEHEQDLMAVVSSTISPQNLGSVRVFGVFWRAMSEGQGYFPAGATVKVRYRQGNTLIVSDIT